jgi:signal transduction histidine kinase
VSADNTLANRTRTYVLSILAGGILITLLAALAQVGPHEQPKALPWLLMALFLGALATESRPVQTASGPELTVVSALFVAAILLTGGVLGPAAVCAGTALAEVFERRPPVRIAFNAAQYLIASALSASIYELLIERRGYDWHAALLDPSNLPVLAAVITSYFLLNSGLVSGVIALDQGLPFWQVWRQAHNDIRAQYLAMVSLGVIMALLWQLAPWTWLLVVLVVGVVHLSFAQAEHLRQRSEALAAASAESERLRAAAEEHLRMVSMVYRSSVELVGAREAEAVPRVLVDIAARAFNFDSAAVFLFGQQSTEEVRLAASWSLLPQDERVLARVLSDPSLHEGLRRGETIFYNAGPVQGGNGRAPAGPVSAAVLVSTSLLEEALRWQTIVGLPLLASEMLFGMFVAGYTTRRALDLQDRQLLGILVHQGAQALLRLRLAREAAEVETLREVDRARTQILATVSHELRSPLQAIAGYSEVLCEQELSPQEVREIARQIYVGAQRLKYLVDDIVTFYRLGSGAFRIFPERLELPPVLHEAVMQVQAATAGTRPLIEVSIAEPLPCVYADRMRVLQILTNLLSNAVKFSPPGAPIQLCTHAEGDWVKLVVKDHGIGIPAEDLPHIFEPFYRTRQSEQRRIQGTGLGLAIVKRLVELQGGRIEVHSTVGVGSTFMVCLPVAVPQPQHT